jgi:hypothetical protein
LRNAARLKMSGVLRKDAGRVCEVREFSAEFRRDGAAIGRHGTRLAAFVLSAF